MTSERTKVNPTARPGAICDENLPGPGHRELSEVIGVFAGAGRLRSLPLGSARGAVSPLATTRGAAVLAWTQGGFIPVRHGQKMLYLINTLFGIRTVDRIGIFVATGVAR